MLFLSNTAGGGLDTHGAAVLHTGNGTLTIEDSIFEDNLAYNEPAVQTAGSFAGRNLTLRQQDGQLGRRRI